MQDRASLFIKLARYLYYILLRSEKIFASFLNYAETYNFDLKLSKQSSVQFPKSF